ncbi:hypothetical protein AB0H45_34830 [Streptomyces atroolivaceus]|uniref:hypothetical protein n=1 Tax=Streptomyces atroolivaceus TaxID=66869 RepID=UPI0033EB5E43
MTAPSSSRRTAWQWSMYPVFLVFLASHSSRAPRSIAACVPAYNTNGRQVSRNSLLSDLANLTERDTRLAGHVARLEQCLSEALGQDAWRATGLGAPTDTDTLQRTQLNSTPHRPR